MARGHHVEPLERIGFFAAARFVEVIGGIGELRGELRDQFGADFVAAGTNAWAYCRKKIARIGLKAGVKFTNGFFEDAGQSAAPAGVNGGDGAVLGIDEKDGDAIGGLNAEKKAGSFGKRGVAFTRFFGS